MAISSIPTQIELSEPIRNPSFFRVFEHLSSYDRHHVGFITYQIEAAQALQYLAWPIKHHRFGESKLRPQ